MRTVKWLEYHDSANQLQDLSGRVTNLDKDDAHQNTRLDDLAAAIGVRGKRLPKMDAYEARVQSKAWQQTRLPQSPTPRCLGSLIQLTLQSRCGHSLEGRTSEGPNLRGLLGHRGLSGGDRVRASRRHSREPFDA